MTNLLSTDIPSSGSRFPPTVSELASIFVWLRALVSHGHGYETAAGTAGVMWRIGGQWAVKEH